MQTNPTDPAAQAADARFRALVEHAADVLLDAQSGIRHASPSASRVLGCTPEELQRGPGRTRGARTQVDLRLSAMCRPVDLLTRLVRAGLPALARPGDSAPVPRECWPLVAASAVRHGLTPLLHQSLSNLDRLNELPPDVASGLRAERLRAGTASWLAFEALDSLLADFATAGIPVVLLKGCALAPFLYPDPGLRPLGDLDLLIPHAAAREAERRLAAQGYLPVPELTPGFQGDFANEQTYVRRAGRPAQVDLHWHILSPNWFRCRAPIEWFWERTADVAINGRAARTFAPTAQLLHLCTHLAFHRTGADRRLWSLDIALLLARHGGEIDWGEFCAALESLRLGAAARSALARVTEHWAVALPKPGQCALASLSPARAERSAFWTVTQAPPLVRAIGSGLAASGLRRKARYFRAYLLPSREFMRARYRVRRPIGLPAAYLRRLGRGACSLVSTLGQLALALTFRRSRG